MATALSLSAKLLLAILQDDDGMLPVGGGLLLERDLRELEAAGAGVRNGERFELSARKPEGLDEPGSARDGK